MAELRGLKKGSEHTRGQTARSQWNYGITVFECLLVILKGETASTGKINSLKETKY